MAITTLLHTFKMGDVEDPYLYASSPIYDWQQTEHGQWVMKHAVEPPTFFCDADPSTFGFKVSIYGDLLEHDHTYFMLKWGKHD